jgi:hypothetical protein
MQRCLSRRKGQRRMTLTRMAPCQPQRRAPAGSPRRLGLHRRQRQGHQVIPSAPRLAPSSVPRPEPSHALRLVLSPVLRLALSHALSLAPSRALSLASSLVSTMAYPLPADRRNRPACGRRRRGLRRLVLARKRGLSAASRPRRRRGHGRRWWKRRPLHGQRRRAPLPRCACHLVPHIHRRLRPLRCNRSIVSNTCRHATLRRRS